MIATADFVNGDLLTTFWSHLFVDEIENDCCRWIIQISLGQFGRGIKKSSFLWRREVEAKVVSGRYIFKENNNDIGYFAIHFSTSWWITLNKP